MTGTLRERIVEAIIKVRDASPRLANDADSEEIADAVLDVLAQQRGDVE